MDAKGKSKKAGFLCEQLIQVKTPDFTRGKLYEIVKLCSIQRNIGGFHKDFYIKKIEELAYQRIYYKKFGKIMFLTLDINHLNPYQATSVLGHIILNDLALIPTVKYRINSLTTIVPYIWRVDV